MISRIAVPPLAGAFVVASLLFCATGCVTRMQGPLPTDAELIVFFHAHRADLDSLRDNGRILMREHKAFDPDLYQQWVRLIRRLELPGGGALESERRIMIPARRRWIAHRLIDEKGFAWIDSIPSAARDTLDDLDALDARALKRAARHVRPLEGHWWLYRQIAEPDSQGD
jgi:hypothetical protein